MQENDVITLAKRRKYENCNIEHTLFQHDGSAPKFMSGIAHDFGKIWCLKWMPSGGESTAKQEDSGSDDDILSRLGLLAAACSDGTVRIFAIPSLVNNH